MEYTPAPSEMPESPGPDDSAEAPESTPDITADESSTAEPERLNLNNEGAVDSLCTRLAADDSGEIWTGEAAEDNLPDHAVVVTGIDPERGTMLLSDPGSPDRNLSEIPIEVFMDSWADSQNAMIVCDEVPETTPASGGSDLTGEAISDPLGSSPENLAAAARPTDGAEHQSWEETTSWAVRAPWMLLPVTLPATTVNTL